MLTFSSTYINILWPPFAQCEDCWIWASKKSGVYSTVSSFQWLAKGDLVDLDGVSWSWIHKMLGPKKFFFLI